MALVYSADGYRAKKSAGNKTYRYVNGNLVMSAKRTSSEASKAAARGFGGGSDTYNPRVALFKLIQLFAGAHLTAINAAFDASKSGNHVNVFMSKNINYIPLMIAWKDEVSTLYNGGQVTLTDLETALTAYVTAQTYGDSDHPKVYRAKRTGFEPQYLTAAWNDEIVLVPNDKSQRVVAISNAADTGDWSVSMDAPAVISGANMSALDINRTAVGGNVINLRRLPSNQFTLTWDDLVAMDVLTAEEIAAGTVSLSTIHNAYTGATIWQGTVNP